MSVHSVSWTLFAAALIAVISGTLLHAQDRYSHPALEREETSAAAADLKNATERAEPGLAELRTAVESAIAKLGDEHYAAGMLRRALEEAAAAQEADAAADHLRQELLAVAESLTFRPVKEAELPRGFPAFTPLHAVEVKSYPAYRLARTEMNRDRSGENSAFYTLFGHIKRNEIAMTAPVQVDYSGEEGQLDPEAMAFLYASPELGDAGADPEDESVEVTDVPALVVISTGVRGDIDAADVAQARERLEAWLKQHADLYHADGPLRTMGYNSPFIPEDRQYFEVQIPVKQLADASNDSADQ